MSILNSIDNNAPIAFFDSGVGGLTVLNKVKKILPNENFISFGDTLHVPYGEKTKEQLLEYSDDIIKFFESKGCKAVVMACNTTSSVIYDDICGKYNVKLYRFNEPSLEFLKTLGNKNLTDCYRFALADIEQMKKNYRMADKSRRIDDF